MLKEQVSRPKITPPPNQLARTASSPIVVRKVRHLEATTGNKKFKNTFPEQLLFEIRKPLLPQFPLTITKLADGH